MNFDAAKYSVMDIGHNNMQGNYNMSNQQLPNQEHRELGFFITKDLTLQKQTEKAVKWYKTVQNGTCSEAYEFGQLGSGLSWFR